MWAVSTFASALCALMLLAQPALAAKRVALVIGNSTYQNVVKLTNPSNDAEAMAATLKGAGFDVVDLRRDLKAVEMRRALRDFSDRSRDADIAVLYFAGHGIEIDGTNYIIPTDALLERDIDAYDEAIPLDRLLTVIEPAKRLRLVILDACRDNPFKKNMKRTVVSRSIERGLARVEPAGSNTLVAFAAKAGSTAADGDSKNSPFTTALIKYLPRPGLDLRKAFGFVRDDVLKATNNRQEPFLYGSLGGEDLALVEAAAPVKDAEPEIRRAYELALQISTPDVWASFIATYPHSFYSELAKAQHRKLMEDAARSAIAQEQLRIAADKAAAARTAEAARAAEQTRLAAEKKRREDAARDAEAKAAEQKAAEVERARQIAEAKAQEQARLAADLAAKAKAAEEARVAEQARLIASKKAREEEAAKAAEARAAEQKAAEVERARQLVEAKAQEQARRVAEQAAKAKAAEEAKAAEQARLAAEKRVREDAAKAAEVKAAEAKAAEARAAEARAAEARAAEARAAEAKAAEAKAAEQKAAEAERARQVAAAKAQEQVRLAAEQAAKAKASEEAKIAERAAEQARLAAEQRAREEAAEAQRKLAEQAKPGTDDGKARDPKAATQLAALSPDVESAAKPAQQAASDIPRLLQGELRRVGCLKGEISGSWNEAAQKSLQLFNKNAGTKFDVKLASVDALESIRVRPARVCPLICEHGFRPSGEDCVRISCEANYELGDDNTCERVRPKRPARREAPPVAAKPPAERPAATEPAPSGTPGQKRSVKEVEALWAKCSNNGHTGRNNRTFSRVNACVMRGM
ncbi:hypothetical protein Bra471DRAFT_02271 [Bradyrhizobium sp. WSM471]|nr:hypothetical protein Bra471DRAFT_02271 [Bradyrhizobium sp. WSM471]